MKGMSIELAVPFHLGSRGVPATVSDQNAQVRQHVLALVSTFPAERVTVPGYGVRLTPLTFENFDAEEIGIQVRTLVTDALSLWEPGVELTAVDAKEENGQVSVVNLGYARRDAADSGTAANSNTAIIGADGTIREIIRG